MELVLISHGPLCEAMKESTEMILGPDQPIKTLALTPEMGLPEYQEKLKGVLEECTEPFVICDILGGTPCNAASRLIMEGMNFPLYAGLNLPMVIGVINDSWMGTTPDAIKAGTEGIRDVKEFLITDDEDE